MKRLMLLSIVAAITVVLTALSAATAFAQVELLKPSDYAARADLLNTELAGVRNPGGGLGGLTGGLTGDLP